MRTWLGDGDGGGLQPESAASVSVLDHGLTVGDGVFETLKVTPAGPFALTRHLRRLCGSASTLGLPAPDTDLVRRAVAEVLAANADDLGPLGRLRITHTAGAGPLGSDRGSARPTLVVSVARTEPWPSTTSAVTVPWRRNERSAIAGAKSTSYAENVVALRAAQDRDASEALFGNTRDELCEGSGSNVFVVVGGQVLTPVSSGCLPGITRELVLEWLGGQEAVLPLAVLEDADEVFLTSSTRNVHPVVRLDVRTWTAAGPVSDFLRAAFDSRAASDIDP